MINKLSIRNKLIISILAGCLIPYLIGGLYIKGKTEDWLYNNNIERANMLLRQTAEQVDESILENMGNLVSMIAMDEQITHIGSEINSYIDYDQNTFKFRSSESEAEIMEYFRTIKDSQDIVTMVSVGTEEGGYIEYPKFKPTAPYDPRTRGWYIDAINKKETVISEPYITKESKELVVSLVKSVTLKDKNIGVVCLTIKLDNLMKGINALKYGESGYINILSHNNIFINSPHNKEWLFHSAEDLGLDVFSCIDNYNSKSFEAQVDSVNKIFNVYISPYSGWKYISVIDKSEILEQSKVLTGVLIVIYFITFLIVLALILLIADYITKPILKIANIINKMATFKFDIYEDKSLKVYTHQNDEVGEISRALNGMQKNFIELKSKIVSMDEEIQNIDIDESSIHQLELSKDNPFAGIANSINVLLQKVHSSIEQIKLFNEEISYKNELLMGSEEELTAQLEEINSQKEFILFIAEHDPLTNLPNRRKFNEKLNQVLSDNGMGAVALLDIDNFKGINDTMGHLFGDKVLQYISQRLEEMSNQNIFVSRFGGDEFLLLYECTDGLDEILHFAEQLHALFNERFIIEQNIVNIEFSMGISLFPKDSHDINQLIMNADLALYFAKNRGRNNYVFFTAKMADHLKFKSDIKIILREAITNDAFKMLYQPQVDIRSGEIIGYEALVRLKNHSLSPIDFIPIAEEDGMIITIGRIVTKMVVEQIHQWQQKGYDPKPVTINFSAVQIHDYNYLTYLMDLLELNDVKPEHIIIEITENIFLENKETTIAFLNELKVHGIKIFVDDFGTGYSSLSYLIFLPIDAIKLDRTLSTKFLELDNIAVMDNLISLAHSLNLKVIAEGIEEYEQVKRLIAGNCDAIQGYYFSKPLEVEDVEKTYGMIFELE